MKYYNVKARQAGMTLIELTVVLLVLIGLAGLLIPYVSGFISRTHDSTGTNNLAALNNAIQRFQTQYNSFPDDLHSLIETGTTTVYGDLMNTNMLTGTTYTEDGATTMAGTEVPLASLRRAGISSVFDMKTAANSTSATFDAGNASVTIPMPSSGSGNAVNVATLNAGDRFSIENHLATAFGRQVSDFDSTCYDYVVMGIGQESEMTGRVLQEAPIHFAQNGDMGPQNKYNRFVAVFQVDKLMAASAAGTAQIDAGGATEPTSGCKAGVEQAKFIGTAMVMMPNHIIGLAEELGTAYANMANK
jgi:type II secretory pathway pseudopilin PulG